MQDFMKKIFAVLIMLLLAAIAAAYVFIPKQIAINHYVTAKTNEKWAFKYLMHANGWKQWWSAGQIHETISDTSFNYKGLGFHIDSLYYNALNIMITDEGRILRSKVNLIEVSKNEVGIAWQCVLNGSNNPLKRLIQYRRAVKIKESMIDILSRYQKWLNVPENIYGFNVQQGKIIDTLLVSTRAFFEKYPSVKQIDSMMQILRHHVNVNGADVVGYPMLNIINDLPKIFNTQVALPINKMIPQTNAIRIKRMFPGNALVTRIKGGPYTIGKAYEACENYRLDFSRSSPAVPFQSLITDRIAIPDTARWETIIYYPVY